MNLSDKAKTALDYAAVKQRRQAIETAIRMLNEMAIHASAGGVKANKELMAIRDLLDEKDQELFLIDQELNFQIMRF